MKKIYFLVLFSILISANVHSAQFIDGLEDVPLMDGLKQQIDSENVAFGNEESRFIETYLLSSTISFKEVEKFYIDTLPQLGWRFGGKKNNALSFYRDGEVLEIVKEKINPLLIRITLKSKG